MNDGNTLEDKLAAVFAMYPDKKKVFVASDLRMFFTEHEADAYAQGLRDRAVLKRLRDEGTGGTEGLSDEGTGGTTGTEGLSDEGTLETAGTVEAPETVVESEAVKEPEVQDKPVAKTNKNAKNK